MILWLPSDLLTPLYKIFKAIFMRIWLHNYSSCRTFLNNVLYIYSRVRTLECTTSFRTGKLLLGWAFACCSLWRNESRHSPWCFPFGELPRAVTPSMSVRWGSSPLPCSLPWAIYPSSTSLNSSAILDKRHFKDVLSVCIYTGSIEHADCTPSKHLLPSVGGGGRRGSRN